jgi:hypothetical protein
MGKNVTRKTVQGKTANETEWLHGRGRSSMYEKTIVLKTDKRGKGVET